MGRMFRIITEGSLDHSVDRPCAVAVPDAEPFVRTGAPFIEVGGPQGPVHSLPRVERAPVAAPVVRPVADPYLSITLHPIAAQLADPLPNAVAADLVALHLPEHPVSEEYRVLREEIRAQIGDGPKVVAFTGMAIDRGTTTVLLNLGLTLAAEPGVRVLVVDTDFSRPSAARMLGLGDSPGLAEVLSQETPLAWALQPTAVPRMQLLAAGDSSESTATALALHFPKLVDQLRQWFDWILLDGGAWSDSAESGGLVQPVDAIYIVTRAERLNDPACAAARDQILRHGGLLRGYISTK